MSNAVHAHWIETVLLKALILSRLIDWVMILVILNNESSVRVEVVLKHGD